MTSLVAILGGEGLKNGDVMLCYEAYKEELVWGGGGGGVKAWPSGLRR